MRFHLPYVRLYADETDLFSFYRSGSVVWMNDVAFIAPVNVLEVELIWSSFFFRLVLIGPAAGLSEIKKSRAQMSLLMIRLYALYAFAIEFFFSRCANRTIRMSYRIPNQKLKIQTSRPIYSWISISIVCLFEKCPTVFNHADALCLRRSRSNHSKGEWKQNISSSQKRFIVRIDSGIATPMS